MTLRLGIIGCGQFVHHYHIPALRRRDDVQLVGVCDPNPSVDTHNLCAEADAILFSDVDRFVDDVQPDAILVSSPHALHAAHIETCLQARCHVLVDKPFVLSVSDAMRLTRLASEGRLVAAVAFNRRFDEGFHYGRSVINEGKLGKIVHVETIQLGYPSSGWYTDPTLSGGGPFTGRGTHMADIIPWLTGRAVESVFGRVVFGNTAKIVDSGGFIVASLGGPWWHATILAGDPWNLDEVRLYGTMGSLVVRRPMDQTYNWVCEHRDLTGSIIGQSAIGQIQFALDDFVKAVTSGSQPACTFADAVSSVAIIEGAFRTARLKRGEAFHITNSFSKTERDKSE